MPKPKQNQKFQTLLFVGLAGAGLLLLLFASAAVKLPGFVQVTLEGTLQHLDNFDTHTAEYFIVTNEKKWIKISTKDGSVPKFTNNVKIRVRGILAGDQITLTAAESQDFTITEAPQTAAVSVTGQRKVATILFFTQNDAEPNWTKEQARKVVYDINMKTPYSSAAYWYESSFGKLSLTGAKSINGENDTFGVYKVTADNTSGINCHNGDSLAKQKAAQDGFVESNYNFLVFIAPCFDRGAGGGDGNTGVAVSEGISMRTISHELGHVMTLGHANALDCSVPKKIDPACKLVGYGDTYDVMGRGLSHSNNVHKDMLGFLNPENVKTITSSGDYTLYPIEKTSSGPQALKLTFDSYYKEYRHLYLEYRRPYGMDSFSADHPAVNGIGFRLRADTLYNWQPGTYWIDVNPETATFDDAFLPLNKCFKDIEKNLTILTLGLSSEQAKVRVALGGEPIDCSPPKITVTHPQTGNVYTLNCISTPGIITDTTFSGQGCVSFNATDESGMDRAELYFDNKLIKTFTTFPTGIYTFPAGERGTKTLKIIAYDRTGLSATYETKVVVIS